MRIIGISGSASPKSSNYYLLEAIQNHINNQHQMEVYDDIHSFELFTPEKLKKGVSQSIFDFKKKLLEVDVIIISTPEYTHNIPAVLKNMMEWCTHSGEFSDKRILPITFTPHEPRGEFAMQSLLNSLKAMKAKIVMEFPLYKTDAIIEDQKILFPKETQIMLDEALLLLLK